MKLIVGLGNPGEKYLHTRHNLGFDVLEKFLRHIEPLKQSKWESKPKLKADIALLDYKSKYDGDTKVLLAKPTTYMNLSGIAVSNLAAFYKIDPKDIFIVYDEMDLPVGAMKIRFGGAAAGHHGVESIMEKLGTDQFWRMRLGIGVSRHHDEMAKHVVKNAEDFVLGTFSRDEAGKVRELVKKAVKALKVCLDESTERAMNQFNTK